MHKCVCVCACVLFQSLCGVPCTLYHTCLFSHAPFCPIAAAMVAYLPDLQQEFDQAFRAGVRRNVFLDITMTHRHCLTTVPELLEATCLQTPQKYFRDHTHTPSSPGLAASTLHSVLTSTYDAAQQRHSSSTSSSNAVVAAAATRLQGLAAEPTCHSQPERLWMSKVGLSGGLRQRLQTQMVQCALPRSFSL